MRPIAKRWIALVTILVIFSASLAHVFNRYQATSQHVFRSMDLQGDWIAASQQPVSSGYFRKRFDINRPIRHAWMVVVAKDGFEVTVNRNPAGRIYLWRPTRPFQNGTSAKGQTISNQKPAMALNFPREYQWTGHKNYLLPTFLDITSHLRQGRNVIGMEIESRSANAAIAFHGEIQLWDGEIIPICSDTSWKAEPVPPGPQLLDWTEPAYWDKEWNQAIVTKGPAERFLRNVPNELFSRPFNGRWMSPQPSHSDSKFVTTWKLDRKVDEAWLRIVTNRRFELFVNEQRVSVANNRSDELDNGQWVLGRDTALDPIAAPELLDPDEAAEFFVGEKVEQPRDAQANLREFKDLKIKTHLPFRNYKTTNRAEEGGEFDPTRTLAESRRTPEKPDLPAEKPIPNSLKRDRASGGFLAYSIGGLLKQGDNRIEIRSVASENDMNWRPSFAVDGEAVLADGSEVQLPSAESWKNDQLPVEIGAPVAVRNQQLPPLNYRGIALRKSNSRFPLFVFLLAGFSFMSLVAKRIDEKHRFRSEELWLEGRHEPGYLSALVKAILAATIVLNCGILLENSFQERHEILWFEQGWGWHWLLIATIAAMIFTGVVECLRCRRGNHGARAQRLEAQATNPNATGLLINMPKSRIWPHAIVWVLLVCALLRGYKLDLQPLDDDEYASTQAIMAILETGTPAFVPDDIYYTRSPLYHYFTAAVAWPFGGNLWALRLQSVCWSMATAFLLYLCGSRLLKSPWIGFAAMVLLAIHPFQIFTGHVIRFYQMQQFFALLTIYLFCRGFVCEQKQKYRIATLFAFLAAVLSQEISIVLGLPLVLGYILFARDLGWRKNTQLIILSIAVVSIIALDLLAFKTLCLTRTEGVSPNVEASIKPHFWYPMNLFAIFVGYSRLHVVLSFFCLLGLPLVWRSRNHNLMAFSMFLFSGVLITNLLVSHISLRYQYWLFSVWILVSLFSVRLIVEFVRKLGQIAVGGLASVSVPTNHFATAILFGLIFCTTILSWSPWRIPGTYEERILGDSTGCVRWVKSQMRPGDKLAITEPHTHAAFLESGKIDYDIAIPLLYDFAVFHDGRLIDRNGGGEIVSNVDEIISVLEKQDRVWILLNREKFRTRGKNLRWEYPGARFEMFLRRNCELKHRSYLWHAYLWDATRGQYLSFSKQQ